MKTATRCVHCQQELQYGERFLSPWLGGYEHHPLCPEGLRWRAENTIEVNGIRYQNKDWAKIKPKEDSDVQT